MRAGIASPRPTRFSLVAELLGRQRALALYGLAMLPLAAMALALQAIDPRMLASGIGVWIKPAKFFLSIGVFALTAAWFFHYMRPDRRGSVLMQWTVCMLIASATFELAYICWQAAQGLESHFNVGTPFHAIMYGLMGAAAVLLVGTTLPIAWEIARRPLAGLDPTFRLSVVIGLLLTFLLGGGLGGYMSSQPGHAVGPAGESLPFFGWNGLGGDLRVAHFLGIHAEQALPVAGALLVRTPERWRSIGLAAVALGYVAVTLATFVQAVCGRTLGDLGFG